jgi:alkyl hydroperoxide reductase subunit AhpC
METGRSIIEIIRVIDSLQARAEHGPNIVTPANWQPVSTLSHSLDVRRQF